MKEVYFTAWPFSNFRCCAGRSLAGNSSNINFQATLDAKGYPSTSKRIAISNGSGYGERLPFNEGERVIFWSYRSFLVDIDAHVYAIPTKPNPLPTV